MLGVETLGFLQEQLMQTLNVFVKTHLVSLNPAHLPLSDPLSNTREVLAGNLAITIFSLGPLPPPIPSLVLCLLSNAAHIIIIIITALEK